MTLTKDDLKAITSIVQGTENRLTKKMKSLKSETTKELQQTTNILKIHMNVEFKKIDTKVDQIARTTEESKRNIIKAGELLKNHVDRINTLERELHAAS